MAMQLGPRWMSAIDRVAANQGWLEGFHYNCLLIYNTTVWDWIHEFRCYEAKIEGSEKAAARGLNPGYLCLELPVVWYWATTARRPLTLTTLYICKYCTGGTECLSCTPGSHSVCAVRTPLGVNRKILSIRKEPMLSGFLTLNAQSLLPHAGNKS